MAFNTTLTLKKQSTSASTSGSRSISWSTVQNIIGELQPVRETEKVNANRNIAEAEYKLYIWQSQFTNSTNEAELKESNRFISGSRIFEIVGIKDWTAQGKYYLVYLKEIK